MVLMKFCVQWLDYKLFKIFVLSHNIKRAPVCKKSRIKYNRIFFAKTLLRFLMFYCVLPFPLSRRMQSILIVFNFPSIVLNTRLELSWWIVQNDTFQIISLSHHSYLCVSNNMVRFTETIEQWEPWDVPINDVHIVLHVRNRFVVLWLRLNANLRKVFES